MNAPFLLGLGEESAGITGGTDGKEDDKNPLSVLSNDVTAGR